MRRNTAGGPRQPRVLVVDDEPGYLALLERHQVTAGYEVLTAANGA